MSEQLRQEDEGALSEGATGELGKMTLLEAMAQDTEAVGIDRSNASTLGADFDDQ